MATCKDPVKSQDPDDDLDYERSWADWLAPYGDTIASSSWILDPGIELGLGGDGVFTDTTATVWLKGGTVNNAYKVTNHIVTTDGRQKDYTFILKIEEQ